jgi:hypothetical protein
MSMSVGYPMKTVVMIKASRTASEARATSKRLNAEARRDRERKEQAHQARQRELDEMNRRLKAQGPVRLARARVNVAEVYRSRREATEAKTATTTPMPRRPRSFGELAARHYGAPTAEADALIPAGSRGGAR